jgi:3-hydroxybutyryl-CoA dehydratase
MTPPLLPRRTFGTPAAGQKATFTRTLTEADVALFIGVTWDVNPYHTDDAYAGASRFGRRIVPGLLTASLLTHLGGLWAFLATEMRFEFIGPVYVGETVTAEAEITAVDETRGTVTLRCRCVSREGREVLRAEISGRPGRFEA